VTRPSLTGIILAGGKSRRMGRDKAALAIGEETLLARAERLLRTAGVDRLVILGRADHPAGVADSTPYAGPAAALADWLNAHPHAGHIVVVPIDMPRLRAETLAPLIANGAAAYEGFPLPFTAFAPNGPLTPAVRVRELLSVLEVRMIPVPPACEDDFININRPEDFTALTGNKFDSQSK